VYYELSAAAADGTRGVWTED